MKKNIIICILSIYLFLYHTIALKSHVSKVMFKILQARLQQYMNCELLDVQAGFRKGRGTRDQTANIHWIIEKVREFQKNIYFCFIDYAKAFDWQSTVHGVRKSQTRLSTHTHTCWKITFFLKEYLWFHIILFSLLLQKCSWI